jgi:hypothetical protein
LIEAKWVSPSWRGPVLHWFERTVKKRVTEAAAMPAALESFVRIVQRRGSECDVGASRPPQAGDE